MSHHGLVGLQEHFFLVLSYNFATMGIYYIYLFLKRREKGDEGILRVGQDFHTQVDNTNTDKGICSNLATLQLRGLKNSSLKRENPRFKV